MRRGPRIDLGNFGPPALERSVKRGQHRPHSTFMKSTPSTVWLNLVLNFFGLLTYLRPTQSFHGTAGRPDTRGAKAYCSGYRIVPQRKRLPCSKAGISVISKVKPAKEIPTGLRLI